MWANVQRLWKWASDALNERLAVKIRPSLQKMSSSELAELFEGLESDYMGVVQAHVLPHLDHDSLVNLAMTSRRLFERFSFLLDSDDDENIEQYFGTLIDTEIMAAEHPDTTRADLMIPINVPTIPGGEWYEKHRNTYDYFTLSMLKRIQKIGVARMAGSLILRMVKFGHVELFDSAGKRFDLDLNQAFMTSPLDMEALVGLYFMSGIPGTLRPRLQAGGLRHMKPAMTLVRTKVVGAAKVWMNDTPAFVLDMYTLPGDVFGYDVNLRRDERNTLAAEYDVYVRPPDSPAEVAIILNDKPTNEALNYPWPFTKAVRDIEEENKIPLLREYHFVRVGLGTTRFIKRYSYVLTQTCMINVEEESIFEVNDNEKDQVHVKTEYRFMDAYVNIGTHTWDQESTEKTFAIFKDETFQKEARLRYTPDLFGNLSLINRVDFERLVRLVTPYRRHYNRYLSADQDALDFVHNIVPERIYNSSESGVRNAKFVRYRCNAATGCLQDATHVQTGVTPTFFCSKHLPM